MGERFEQSNRCGNCGCTHGYTYTTKQGQTRRKTLTHLVTDWRTDYLCNECVASFEWRDEDWEFIPPDSSFSLPHYKRRNHDNTTATNIRRSA